MVLALLFLLPAAVYAAHDYADALYKSIYYYGAQRCGDTKSWIHNACHLQDGQPQGCDLTGGWHDCGDHPKFGQTNSYSAAALLMAYSYFPSAYEDRYSQDYSAPPPNGIPDVLDEVKIHTDYLLKALNGGRAYFQTGNGDWDHIHFVEPAYQSTAYNQANGGNPRPGYYVTQGGSNCNGDSAAALALMSILYRPYSSSYADQCLTAAIGYYNIGNTSPGVVNSTGVGYTGSANWADDMCWGAIELYRATGTASYLTAAQNFYSNGNFSKRTYWAACYDHVEPFAIYELYKRTGTNTYLNDLTTEVNDYKALMATCGIGQYAYRTSWGSLRYAGNMALIAAFLHSENNNAADLDFVKKNVDFILGTHGNITGAPGSAQGKSFLIGYENPDYPGTSWPQHPHHRAAFGKQASGDTDFAAEDASPGSVSYLHQLTGALVGGPRSTCSNYNDDIGDYVANEVGVDYNAGFVGACAYIRLKYGTAPATATPTSAVPTATRTPTRTFTRTATPLPTGTDTPLPSATRTWTQTPPPSDTPTGTPTASKTSTPTDTPYFSPTETWTGSPPTGTATPTVTITQTPAASATFTRTSTQTAASSPTFTRTSTAMINTPTPTFTAAPAIQTPTPDIFVLSDALLAPNPYNSSSVQDSVFTCSLNQQADAIKIKVYTLSYRAVLSIDVPGSPHAAGTVKASLPAGSLSKLSNGLYYFTAEGENSGGRAKSSVSLLLIMQ